MGVPIEFQCVKFQNLFSYGNNITEIPLSAKELSLIVGASGAGKSTILDSICFGLFGKPYKKVNKSSIINSVNNKATLVEIDFKIGPDLFRVRRGLKPTVFEILKNGELLDQDAKSTDMQKNLENNILGGVNYNTFLQTCIIGSANFVPFMQLAAKDRREIIETILSLSIFKYASDISKQRLKKLDNERNMLFSEYRIQDSKLEEKIRTSQILLAKKNSDDDIIQQQKKECNDEINALEDENKVLLKQVEQIKSDTLSIMKDAPEREYLDGLMKQGITHKNTKNSLVEKINLWDQGNCPTCGQELDKTDSSIFDYNDAVNTINVIDETLKNFRDEISEGNATLKKIDEKKSEGKTIIQKIERTKDQISNLNKNLEKLNSHKHEKIDENLIDQVKDEIEDTKKLISKAKKEIDNIDENIKYIKLAIDLFKDDGIKSNIIKVFIPLINQYMNEYLKIFEMDIKFEFDENFDEIIQGRGRDDYVYNNFSEGEKKRIDLAVLFSWLKIAEVKNSANMNLLCCDEIMDGSLDYDSVQNLVKILQKLITDSGKSIFVISHRNELKEAFFDTVYNVSKEGQFSYIEEIE